MLNIVTQIIQAIAFVHGSLIMHRDVKPDNILFEERGRVWTVKLADFGMARFRTAEQNDLTSLIGSPQYVAPELMKVLFCTAYLPTYLHPLISGLFVHEIHPYTTPTDDEKKAAHNVMMILLLCVLFSHVMLLLLFAPFAPSSKGGGELFQCG